MRTIAAGTLVLALVILLFAAGPPALLENLDHRIADALTGWAGPGEPSGQIVIVDIDEASLRQYGRWPWPRSILGVCARRLQAAGVRAVVFDMLFPEEDSAPAPLEIPGVSAADLAPEATAAAIARSNDSVFAASIAGEPVVAGFWFGFGGESGDPNPSCLRPLPLVLISRGEDGHPPASVASSAVCSTPRISHAMAGAGFLNATPDADGKLRTLPMVIEYGGQHYPSMALAALAIDRPANSIRMTADARGAVSLRWNGQIIPLEGTAGARLRYRGPRRTLPYVSAADVIGNRVPRERLRGRIAIVGSSASGLQNTVAVPLDPVFPAVEVQATALDNLLQGDFFSRPGSARVAELLAALLAGAIAILLFTIVRSTWAALGTLVLAIAGWLGSAVLVATTGIIVSPLALSVSLICIYSALTLVQYLHERRRAEGSERTLAATRRAAQQASEESEARYRRLVENINDAIIVDDFAGRLVFASHRFREWFGLKDRDIREVCLEDYVAPEWREALRDRHDRRVRGEAVAASFEFQGMQADGSRIWIEALVTPVVENGRIAGTQSALRDISSRKQLEEQYLQAQKMEAIGRLAGGVAHDFNNLLGVILGHSELLKKELTSGSPARERVMAIADAGQRAESLTAQLLAFSRRQILQPRVLNLNTLVLDTNKMLTRMIGEDVEVQVRLDAGLGMINADPGQIVQVIMNLAVNARDAMPRGGTVILSTRNAEFRENCEDQAQAAQAGPYVVLTVRDNGAGMSAETRAHIFEPFFTTKPIGKGTGLGLATVHGIVQQCHGYIAVSSEPGKGTSFEIYFPRVEKNEEAPVSAPVAEPLSLARGGETLLLVEDTEALRTLIYENLQSLGYIVLAAASGEEALALAQDYPDPIHLLISDVVMPHMSGPSLAKWIKTLRPETRVLFMTGYAADILEQIQSTDAGAALIQKPFQLEELAQRLREIFDGKDEARPRAG